MNFMVQLYIVVQVIGYMNSHQNIFKLTVHCHVSQDIFCDVLQQLLLVDVDGSSSLKLLLILN